MVNTFIYTVYGYYHSVPRMCSSCYGSVCQCPGCYGSVSVMCVRAPDLFPVLRQCVSVMCR
ncbi:hypothetical protein NQZ68_038728 [Dissostichus eleginoides]|nr:hypothetical protein NQZ68_038728 [Dissostichus eleginoides]